jgi:hypothetical protein
VPTVLVGVEPALKSNQGRVKHLVRISLLVSGLVRAPHLLLLEHVVKYFMSIDVHVEAVRVVD